MVTEFLIPENYTGDNAGISVTCAGLSEDEYSSIQIFINNDISTSIFVDKSTSNPFYSDVAIFNGLEINTFYKVKCIINKNGIQKEIECSLVSSKKQSKRLKLMSNNKKLVGVVVPVKKIVEES